MQIFSTLFRSWHSLHTDFAHFNNIFSRLVSHIALLYMPVRIAPAIRTNEAFPSHLHDILVRNKCSTHTRIIAYTYYRISVYFILD